MPTPVLSHNPKIYKVSLKACSCWKFFQTFFNSDDKRNTRKRESLPWRSALSFCNVNHHRSTFLYFHSYSKLILSWIAQNWNSYHLNWCRFEIRIDRNIQCMRTVICSHQLHFPDSTKASNSSERNPSCLNLNWNHASIV